MNDLAAVTNANTEAPRKDPDTGDSWVFPASFAQRRLWIIDQLQGPSSLYNVPAAFRVRGRLDPGLLERSFGEVIARHEILRTTFRSVDGEPMQVVASGSDFHLALRDLRTLAPSAAETEVARIIHEECRRPFDLANGPLLRAALLDLGPAEQVLIVCLHHTVTDAWSHDVLMRELTSAYSALSNGLPPSLPELPIQYADFASWQRDSMQGPTLEKELAFWRGKLAGLAPLDLPHSPTTNTANAANSAPVQAMAAPQAPEAEACFFELPGPLTAAVRAMAQKHGVTLFMALLAGWEAFLARYTGQCDIAVGSPISHRSRSETEPLIGFFLNTLVLRTDLSGNPPVREALHRVRDTALEAFAHQDLPFEMIVEQLQPARLPGRNPLLSVMFVLMADDEKTWRTPDAALEPMRVEEAGAKFDLTLHLRDAGSTIKGVLVYDKALFDAAMARRIAAHYETLLGGMAADPDAQIGSLPLLLPGERERILHEWNDTAAPFPADSTVDALFHEQALLNPDAVAIEDAETTVTYGELDAQSDAIAALLAQHGVKPGDAVAISLPRSARLIAGILGILKAGAAYVPLDPAFPIGRLDLMLRESGAKLLIGEGAPPPLKSEATWLPLPLPPSSLIIHNSSFIIPPPPPLPASSLIIHNSSFIIPPPSPLPPAYIMFTSGSTGVPKAVRVLHRGISRLVINTNYVRFTPADVVAHASNISFDASTFEIWGALLNGARLVIVPRETLLSPQDLVAFIAGRKVSVLFLTTPLFHQFAREIPGGFGSLRYLVAGGDTLQPEAARAVLQTARPGHFVNGYGPTEATTFAICHEVSDVAPDALSIPIGRPIANTRAYILDAALEPVPVGVAGELYLGGPGIADGYLNDPAATAASFIQDRFSDDAAGRLYKTGDLAKWRDDGVIEFLGRIDNQLKIRGFRVEPGEIEATLLRHPAVRQAVVLPRTDSTGHKQLAAYLVVHHAHALISSELRDYLFSCLPEYMALSAFAFLDTLPLNANGKVDLGALAALPLIDATRPHESPGTWMEAALVEIWEQILDRRPIGVTDDFFELGGHSLLAIRMLAEVEKKTGIRILPRLLFENATIRHLTIAARRPEEVTGGNSPSVLRFEDPKINYVPASLSEPKPVPSVLPLVRVQPEGSKPPLFFFHGDFLFGGLYLANLARYLPRDRPCYAIEPHGFDGADPPATIEEMAASRLKTILEVQPDGPYFLGGFCNGGLVAFQVAQLLRAQRKEIACVVLLGASGINTRFRNLQKLAALVARIRRLDQTAARDLFLKWQRHSLFVELLVRHHLKELQGKTGALHPMLIWAKMIGFARWLLRLAGVRTGLSASDIRAAALDQNLESLDRPIWNIYTKAVSSFVPTRYDGKVFLFRETDLPPELAWMGSDLGWSRVARSLSIHNIPGGHFTITEHSNIMIFAEQLKVCLEEAEAERGA